MSFSVIQTIMGMIGSVGFAVLFGVRGRKLAVIALGSGAGWAVYHVLSGAGISGRIWNLLRAGAHRGRSHCSGDHTCFPYGKIFYKPEESFAKQGK